MLSLAVLCFLTILTVYFTASLDIFGAGGMRPQAFKIFEIKPWENQKLEVNVLELARKILTSIKF